MSTQGVVCSALERVNDLLKRETAAAIKEVLDRAVEQLNSDLGAVADTVSSDAERNRRVRELAYDIEDSVECFVRSNASKWSSSYLRCLFKYCSSERSFVEDVHVFSRRARELMTTGSSTDNLPSEELQVSIGQPAVLDTNYRDQDVFIGFDNYNEKVKGLLLREERGLSVIAVCGMGGIGKTTLARSAYDDPSVIYNFACRAWVYVGQSYNSREILLALLFSLSPDNSKKKLAAMETRELTEMLFKFLCMRRYLICLDDVWSTEAWDSLRVVFSDDHNGSRILITTRVMDVAHYTSTPTPPIQMQLLDEEESLQLLLMKSGIRRHPGASNPKTAEIAKQIARSCKGLPLAITVVGQILSRTSSQNWELILTDLSSRTNQEEKLLRVLDLSYKHLPFRLKLCFLYMGHFPPDETISVDKLHLLWMAEGLISKTNEAAGQEYLTDLADRSMVNGVEKEDLFASSKFKSVRLHDLLRDHCISIGKEEEFFEVIDFFHATVLSIYTCRLAVYLDKYKETSDVTLKIPDAKRIRSILFYETVESMLTPAWPSEFADLSSFPRIRVLDFNEVNFQVKRLPRGIEKLIYLRYLSFNRCYLEEFPSSFGSFSFLETLDLRVIDSCIMTIPNVLRKLTRLRHLYFPLTFQCEGKDKLKLDWLTSLEVVENFDTGSCDGEDLLHLQHLEILKVIVDGNNQDSQDIINNLTKMNSIRRSSFVVRRFDSYSQRKLLTVAKLLQCDAVHAVDIEGHLRPLPTDIKLGFNLTEMEFSESEFSEDHMKILGEHPNLKTLVLRNDAFVEPNLVFSETDFPQLTSLKLATLQYLENWEVESGAMPRLAILTIEQCDKLKMLPSELAEISTLQKLKIGSMPLNFQPKVKQIIEEGMDMGYEISVTFYGC